jgi:chromosome partitioning protein
VAFFNNKGGVGKTSLVYHLAWMFADRGKRVLAVDLDPQANLSAAFLEEDSAVRVWSEERPHKTALGDTCPPCMMPGDTAEAPQLEVIQERLALLPGDTSLWGLEDRLSSAWLACLDGSDQAFREMCMFGQAMQRGGKQHRADVIFVDLGPNLGAVNRAVLIACDYVVIPIAPDLYSLQCLRNLGPTIRGWRKDWRERITKNPVPDLPLPTGKMAPIGYVLVQPSALRLGRSASAYERWNTRVPGDYREYVLDSPSQEYPTVAADENCLAVLRHYRSLMPMAQEARKPMFFLKPSDGAIGALANAIPEVYADFQLLARKIGERSGVVLE